MLSLSQLRQAGRIALRQDQLERAIECFGEIALRCDDEASHYELADTLVRAERYQDALRHFQRASALNPERVRTINQIALIQAQLEQWDLAIYWHLKAVEKAPEDVKAYQYLAQIYMRLGQPALATRWFTRVISLKPDDMFARFSMARLCLNHNLVSEAAALLSELIEVDPTYAPAWVELASLSEQAGSPESALACWQQALNLDAQDPVYRYQTIRLARSLGQTALLAELQNG